MTVILTIGLLATCISVASAIFATRKVAERTGETGVDDEPKRHIIQLEEKLSMPQPKELGQEELDIDIISVLKHKPHLATGPRKEDYEMIYRCLFADPSGKPATPEVIKVFTQANLMSHLGIADEHSLEERGWYLSLLPLSKEERELILKHRQEGAIREAES